MSIRGIRNRFKSHLAAQGFTLIEIMVAVLLLLFAMAGIVPFFLGGLSQASTVRYKSIATNVARERMEQIRQLDYREIEEQEAIDKGLPSLTERFGSSAAQRDLNFDITYVVEESAYEEGTLKKVTVNVGWIEPPRVSAAAITTLIHQQFLGPRIALLEIEPTSSDPLDSPFPLIGSTTKARCHIAQADWGLVYRNLDQVGMAARDVYTRLVFFDEDGQSVPLGDPDDDFKITNTYLRYSTDADGKVDDVWFEYDFDAWSIPDGYWEMRAVAYNEYDEPGNVWRLRARVEKGAPTAPTDFVATPQADNQTVVLTWAGGPERDRAYYVLERGKWDGGGWSGWTPLASALDPKATSYTDQGNVGAELDPWGSGVTPNSYQYRLWAVDSCDPGLVGPAAEAETALPPLVTTTTLPTTTTTAPTTTTSTSSTTTTLAVYSVQIRNVSNAHYNVTIKNGAGNTVFSGTVKKGDTETITGLTPGNYLITATANKKPTITQSFSLPAQAGQIVLTIF